MSKVIVPWDLITNFVTDAFIGYGIPAEDAPMISAKTGQRSARMFCWSPTAAGLKATAATGLSPFTWIGSKPGSKIR